MAVSSSEEAPCLVVRGSRGLCLQAPPDFNIHRGFTTDESKSVKVMAFTGDGNRLAWSNMSSVQVVVMGADSNWKLQFTIPQPKVFCLAWSPLSETLATWEQYTTTAGKAPEPNLHLFNASTGEKLKSFFQKKINNWCPMWSSDERICSRNVNNEVQFYEGNNFDSIQHKLHLPKVMDFSLSPTPIKQAHLVTYVPGNKGGPSFCRLYQFPLFAEHQVIANKSFFQADSVDMTWNKPGSAVLLLTQSEVDKTGGSYYGKQQLHYMSIRGDTAMVGLPKEGPIYSTQWCPEGNLFAVVYGFMPAKATMFDLKGEPVFDFGTGPRNAAMFNPQSSLLMIGGFGNLRGKIEMWDVAKKVMVSTFDAPDSTNVSWCPDGQRLLTTTTAPRLRVSNGYKVWHYSGALQHDKPFAEGDELWEADWQSRSSCPHFTVTKQMAPGIKPTQPVAAKQAYRPPGARGTQSTFKLHDDDEAPQNLKKPDEPEVLSKSAAKNKKRKDQAKAAKLAETSIPVKKRTNDQTDALSAAANHAQANKVNKEVTNNYQGAKGLLFDPQKEKKVRKLNDKLAKIQKLKEEKAEGKELEKNQLEMISKENDIVEELRMLEL
jgi:translation initiation factor 2A